MALYMYKKGTLHEVAEVRSIAEGAFKVMSELYHFTAGARRLVWSSGNFRTADGMAFHTSDNYTFNTAENG